MPAEVLDPRTFQRSVPCFGIDLGDWLSLIGENPYRVFADLFGQYFDGRGVQGDVNRFPRLCLITVDPRNPPCDIHL